MTPVFENVDEIIEKELMIPSQMHTKNQIILRSKRTLEFLPPFLQNWR